MPDKCKNCGKENKPLYLNFKTKKWLCWECKNEVENMQIQEISISKLKPAEYNPQKDGRILQIKKVINYK